MGSNPKIRVQPYLEKRDYNQILALLELWKKHINRDETESHFIARVVSKGIPLMEKEIEKLLGKSMGTLIKELSETRETT